MSEWIGFLLAIAVLWMAVKVVSLLLKISLWLLLAGMAYFFFASVFGWPLP
ncbi:MAG: hypothetical protein Q4B94_04860 [Pseudomonadota bacterium]|nr:hypothetical protein [Pseudomonadota bacterium]